MAAPAPVVPPLIAAARVGDVAAAKAAIGKHMRHAGGFIRGNRDPESDGSALHVAAANGHVAMAAALLDWGAYIDDINRHGETALIVAARCGVTDAALAGNDESQS